MAVFTQFVLCSGVVVPTFILLVLHFINNAREYNAKWSRNKERRKSRSASNNVRMFFDPKQGVVKEKARSHAQHMQTVESVFALLRSLADAGTFGNPTLYKHHPSIKLAKDVADRCKDGVVNFLSHEDADLTLLSSVESTHYLLAEFMDRKPLSSEPVQVLNAFKEQIAVLQATFGEKEKSSSMWKFGGGSWTYKGDATKGLTMALLGPDAVAGKVTDVPDFKTNPIPELAKRTAKLMKSPATKDQNNKEPEAPPGPRLLEPAEMVEGIGIEAGNFSNMMTDLRDKYGVGSNRVLVGVLALLLAAGPVRFLGPVAAIFSFVLLLVQLVFEISRASSQADMHGAAKSLKQSWFRLVFPILLGLLVAVACHRGLDAPKTVGDIQAEHTFLPVPPQYVAGIQDLAGRRTGVLPIEDGFKLVTLFGSKSTYIALIYGVMHANLLALLLLPVPLCYGLQAMFVARYPKWRQLVPQNPVWLHRMLGYFLLSGVSLGAVLWIGFQGFNCFIRQLSDAQICDAFEPKAAAVLDGFVLRFHIVWPLVFFFIPLMIWSKYPEGATKEEAGGDTGRPATPKTAKKSKGEGTGGTEEAQGLLSMQPIPSRGHADDEGEHNEPPHTCELVKQFLYRRIVEVCLLTAALSGTMLAITGAATSSFVPFFVPFWPIILLVVGVQICIKFKTFVLELLPCTSHNLDNQSNALLDHIRTCWWEVAYCSHVAGVFIVLFFALFIRFAVFYAALVPWGLYAFERYIGIRQAGANKASILVGEGKSSYNVDAGRGGDPQPSHVRLVVKKPEGFEYRAGQWAYVSVSRCGTHFGAPGWMVPLQHWHAFSLASAEDEDELEFHIAVSKGGSVVIEDGSEVKVRAGDEAVCRFSRMGHWIDTLFPHWVPFIGKAPETDLCGTKYTATTSGISVNLQGADGTTLKALKPELQWTGRLWNLVQWMLLVHGEKGTPPEQHVRIMGPYGTMPYTCEAHQAVMLIGAGVGFPSTGAMLRKLLHDNLEKPPEERKAVCFMWTASKVDQLLLCFPSLLVDLTRYVHKKSLEDLKSWLTIKIFISSFDAGDFLNIEPGKRLFPESQEMAEKLTVVREWLLGKDGEQEDEDGTYIAQGSLGASFSDILRNSHFTRDEVMKKSQSLGVCFCGPQDLCSWIRHNISSTKLPMKVEFNSEATSG